MKICMITQSNYPGDPRVKREAEALERRGHTVDIICLGGKKDMKMQRFGAVTAYRVFPSLRQENIFRYVVVAFSFFAAALIKLQVLHIKHKYDLIQIHNMPDWLVFSAFFQKISGVPVVLDIHDLTPELFDSKWQGRVHSFFSAAVKYFEKISCRFADEVITVTDGCKDRLVTRGVPADKVTIVLNTPDTSIFQYDAYRKFNTIKENLVLIYHGTMAHRFGVHVAVKSIAAVKEKIPGVKLLLYGKYEYDYYQELVNLIDELNLRDNVILNKSIPLEQIAVTMKDCHIGVVPYLDTPYMHLALSTKTFEYAGGGLPVVATRLDTLVKTFGKDALCYSAPDDPDDLADKILELSFNPEKRRALSIRAFKSLENISGDVMLKRYTDLIEQTVRGKRNKTYRSITGAASKPTVRNYSPRQLEKKKEEEFIN